MILETLLFTILVPPAALPRVQEERVIARSTAPVVHLEEPEVSVPMDHTSRVPTLDVMVNGEGPFRFALDTGAAGHGRIDRSLVERFQLEEVGEVQADDGTGKNTRTAKLVGVDVIQLGGAAFEGLSLLAGDYQRFGRSADGVPTVGILGFGLFQELLLTLDYPGNAVRVTRGELPAEGDPHTVAFEGGSGVASIDAAVGDLSFKAHIDSGNMGGFALPASFLEKLATVAEPVVVGRGATTNNEFEILGATLEGSLEIAGHVLEQPAANFIEIIESPNLGYGILSGFALTIDQAHGLVRFAKPDEGKKETELPSPSKPGKREP